jgi:hypothetical protein
METSSSNNQSENLTLTPVAIYHLKSTSRWATFIAILGLLVVASMLLGLAFIGVLFNMEAAMFEIPAWGLYGFYLGILILYLFPVVYLFRFSFSIRRAIKNISSQKAEEAFGYLKSLFQFIGVLFAITILVYLSVMGNFVIQQLTIKPF